MEHRRPVDGVRGQDVLADQVHRRGPQAVEACLVRQVSGRGEIVEQRVEPDIAHVARIKGQGDAPAQALDRPRDAQVAQRAAQKAQHLVAADLGLDERGVIVDVLDQPVLVGAHAEEIVALYQLLDRPPAVGAVALDQVLFGPKALVGHAVPPCIVPGIDVALFPKRLQDGLDHAHVARLGGADEIVVGDVQALPGVLKAHDHLVGLRLRVQAPLERGVLDLLAVLVGPGQKERLRPATRGSRRRA